MTDIHIMILVVIMRCALLSTTISVYLLNSFTERQILTSSVCFSLGSGTAHAREDVITWDICAKILYFFRLWRRFWTVLVGRKKVVTVYEWSFLLTDWLIEWGSLAFDWWLFLASLKFPIPFPKETFYYYKNSSFFSDYLQFSTLFT